MKKQILLAAATLASIGAVVALATGVTFGFFSASTTSNDNTFSTATVSLGSSSTVACTISNMVPGDESVNYSEGGVTSNTQATKDAACNFQVTYTGSAPAWIGLSTADTSTSTPNLYSAGGLRFQIKQSSGAEYTDGNGNINMNSASDPLFVAADAGGDSTVYKFHVDFALPNGASNSFQNTNTTLDLTVSAVQSGNNGSASGCTAGTQCAGITSWS